MTDGIRNDLHISGPPEQPTRGWVRPLDQNSYDSLWEISGRNEIGYRKDPNDSSKWVPAMEDVKAVEIDATPDMILARTAFKDADPLSGLSGGSVSIDGLGDVLKELGEQVKKSRQDTARDYIAGLDVVAVEPVPERGDHVIVLGDEYGNVSAHLIVGNDVPVRAIREFPTREAMLEFVEQTLILGPEGWRGIRVRDIQPGMRIETEIHANDIQAHGEGAGYVVSAVEHFTTEEDVRTTVTDRLVYPAGTRMVRITFVDGGVEEYQADDWLGVKED